MIEKLKYPLGKLKIPKNIKSNHLESWILIIEEFPDKLEELIEDLSDNQLDTPYRQDGWTIRQVVHHCADSHHNSYTRFKWSLTEDKPMIKTYLEDMWAELFDSKSAPVSLSINHLKAVHAKWVYLLNGLGDEQLNRVFIHPDGNELVSLKENIGIYAWHCNHHFAHIKNLMQAKQWV